MRHSHARTIVQLIAAAEKQASAKLLPNPMLAAVYVAIWEEEGEEPYQLKSDECKPKEHCSDSDWCFDIKTKIFRRYWSYHDEANGNQYVHDEVKGIRLNGG